MKLKFTLIDYIIIILVICAIAFAFIHITTDDSSSIQKTAFDESTVNKIPDTYMKYYRDGYIVTAEVEGFNSTDGERVSLSGNVIWQDDDGGANVNLLISNENGTYTASLYRYNPNADIFIDHISLESNGDKYQNLTEITASPVKVTSLNDLISKIDKTADFELSTSLTLNSLNPADLQEIANRLTDNGKRVSIKASTDGVDSQLTINKATRENVEDADSVLGSVDGTSDKITIRLYNSTDSQIKSVKDSFDVINIRNF